MFTQSPDGVFLPLWSRCKVSFNQMYIAIQCDPSFGDWLTRWRHCCRTIYTTTVFTDGNNQRSVLTAHAHAIECRQRGPTTGRAFWSNVTVNYLSRWFHCRRVICVLSLWLRYLSPSLVGLASKIWEIIMMMMMMRGTVSLDGVSGLCYRETLSSVRASWMYRRPFILSAVVFLQKIIHWKFI